MHQRHTTVTIETMLSSGESLTSDLEVTLPSSFSEIDMLIRQQLFKERKIKSLDEKISSRLLNC